MLLGELVEKNARLYPNKEALIEGTKRFTWSQFRERVNSLASALLDSGLTAGDRVGVLAENCSEYIELYWAVPTAGLVIVPLNYRMVGRELEYLLNDSGCRTLVVHAAYLSTIETIRPGLKTLEQVIVIGGNSTEPTFRGYEEFLAGGPGTPPQPPITEDDLAYLMYTSGTTGRPKGAMLSHRNLNEGAINLIWALQYLEPDDIGLTTAPLYHVAAACVQRAHVHVGATNVVVGGFEPRLVLETVQRERITNFFAAPVMVNALLNQPNLAEFDLSSLRTLVYAAAPMPVEILKRAIAVFGSRFVQAYGMTETGPSGTFLAKRDHVLDGTPAQMRRLGSAGRDMINVQVRVVNEAREDVAPGEVGEVIMHGPCVMRGYWKQPEETAQVIKDGWYHTGDMATVDDDGYVYIVDRKKDMIISGGENIYPREVEEVLYAHPAVLDAAVIGIPDDYWGESVKAFVVLKPGAVATAEDLVELCKRDLASYKKPRYVEFVDTLPRNASGKILKQTLREQHWQGQDRRV